MEFNSEQWLLLAFTLAFVIFAAFVKGDDMATDVVLDRHRNREHSYTTGRRSGGGPFVLGSDPGPAYASGPAPVSASRRRSGLALLGENDTFTDEVYETPGGSFVSLHETLFGKKEKKPYLWLFYNDSEVNSRWWADFGARSSHVIHIPILNLLYDSILSKNMNDYDVQIIGGLTDVAKLLGGFGLLPENMQNTKAFVTEPEEDWIRTAILAKFGGLWLSPSVYCLRPFGKLPNDRVVTFGSDDVPMYSGSTVPEFRALWSPMPEHPLFVYWEKKCRGRLNYQNGGRQVRGDAKSDWIELSKKYKKEGKIRYELSRNVKTGKRIELEDLFAAGTEGYLPFPIPPDAVYLVVPYKELKERRMFGWVLRSSEEQLLESDLAFTHIVNSTYF